MNRYPKNLPALFRAVLFFGIAFFCDVVLAQTYTLGQSVTNTTGNYTLEYENAYIYVEEYKDGNLEQVWTRSETVVSVSPALSRVVVSNRGSGSYEYKFYFTMDLTEFGFGISYLYINSIWVAVSKSPGLPGDISFSNLSHSGSNSDDDGLFSVNWGSSSGNPTSYRVEQRVNSGSWAEIYSGSGTSVSRNVGEGFYEYRVRACNSVGCSSYTSIGSVTVLKTPGTPGTISGPSSDTDGAYSLSWGTSSGSVANYTLQRRISGGSWSTIQSTSSASRSESGLSDGTYDYRVMACNVLSCSGWTANKTVWVVNAPKVVTAQPITPSTTPYKHDIEIDTDTKGRLKIRIPFDVPSGVNDLQPKLRLSYFTQIANRGIWDAPDSREFKYPSVLGHGWKIGGIAKIGNCTPDEPPNIDYEMLCLNGELLVNEVTGETVLPPSPGQKFRPAGTPTMRLEVKGTSGTNLWFEMQSEGRLYRFGTTTNSRVLDETGSQIEFWYLREIIDEFGNALYIDYVKAPSSRFTYPSAIRYGEDSSLEKKVEFFYSLRREDFSTSNPDIEYEDTVVAPVILNTIRSSVGGKTVNEYRLENSYVHDLDLLTAVQMCAFDQDGQNPDCIPAMTFDWGEWVTGNPGDKFKVGIRRVGDSMGNDTFVHYGANTAENFGNEQLLPDEQQEQDALLDWYKQRGWGTLYPEFNEENQANLTPGLVGSVVIFNGSYSTTVKSFEHRAANGQVSYTHYRYAGNVTPDPNSVFLVQMTILSSGEHIYRAYLPKIGRMWLSESHDGFYDVQDLQLEKRHEVVWDQWANFPCGWAGCDGFKVWYKWKERNYIVDENNKVGGKFVSTVISWDASTILPASKTITTQIGYGITTNGLLHDRYPNELLQSVERTKIKAITFQNITSNNRWLVGFPAQIQIDHQGLNRSTKRIKTTNSPIPGNDSLKHLTEFVAYDDGSGFVDEVQKSYVYDSYGNITQTITSGRGFESRSQYFENFVDHRLPQLIRKDVNSQLTANTQLTYNQQLGLVETSTDPNGLAVSNVYDNYGRRVETTDPTGTTSSTQYLRCDSSCGSVDGVMPYYKVIETTSHAGDSRHGAPQRVTYYDSLDRIIRTETEGFDGTSWIKQDFAYDLMGRQVKASLPYSSGSAPFTIKQFDIHDRVIRLDRPDGSYVLYDYEQTNLFSKVTKTHHIVRSDGGGTKTQTREERYDSLGQLIQSTDAVTTANAVTTEYQYDSLGNRDWIRVNSDANTVVQMESDYLGNALMIDDPNAGLVAFEYDGLGQLLSQTDARGVNTTFEYDLSGLLVEKVEDSTGVLPNGPVINTFNYHTRKIGLLSSTSSPGFGQQTYYNTLSQVTSHETHIDINGIEKTYVTDITYDVFGRVETQSYPSGVTTLRIYNSVGYESELRDANTNQPLKTNESMDAFGHIVSTTFGNGIRTSTTYSSDSGQLLSIQSGSQNNLQDLRYIWWSNETLYNRQKLTHSVVETFSYDELNRVVSSQTTGGFGVRLLQYDYDALGNRLSRTSSLSADDQATDYTYNPGTGPHTVDSVTINGVSHSYSYDNSGNLIYDDAANGMDRQLSYNALGKPIRVNNLENGGTVAAEEFAYGPDGKRFYKKSTPSNNQTIYLYGGAFEVVLPASGSTTAVEKTLLGDVMHIREVTISSQSEHYEYLLRDHLGSLDTILDQGGSVISTRNFDPFGAYRQANWSAKATAPSAPEMLLHSAQGFTGHEQVDSVGLVHMNGRVYDPMLGRFMSADPHVTYPNYSQSYNRYAYVLNNPLGAIDPTGYDSCQVTGSYVGSSVGNCNAVVMANDAARGERAESSLRGAVNDQRPDVDREEVESGVAADGTNVDKPEDYSLENVTTNDLYPAYKTANGTVIQLNSKKTELPTGDTLKSLIKFVDNSGLKTVVITGGSEASGHSKGSFHGKNLAIDVAGTRFNSLTNDKVLEVAKSAGFTHGVYEDFNGTRRDHWHLQIGAGNGLGDDHLLTNSSLFVRTY